jgi:single-stranded-DNA-specific exonuclease
MAGELDALNRQRRSIEDDMQREALDLLDAETVVDDPRWGLSLYRPEWHQGVVGLVASRLKERLHRPVFAFAPAADGELKGSGRSIRGLHMRDVLASIHARDPQLITRFGGHAMAAGLSLPEAHFPRFAEAFDDEVRRVLDPAALEGVLETDGELPPAEFTLPNAQLLREAAPWGRHFPACRSRARPRGHRLQHRHRCLARSDGAARAPRLSTRCERVPRQEHGAIAGGPDRERGLRRAQLPAAAICRTLG